MSDDDEFGFADTFDDSFLQQVDAIAARAAPPATTNHTHTHAAARNAPVPAPLPATSPSTTRRTAAAATHTVVPAPSVAPTVPHPANPPFRPPGRAGVNALVPLPGVGLSPNARAGPSRALGLGVRRPPPPPRDPSPQRPPADAHPSSDIEGFGFDNEAFSAEALAQIDRVEAMGAASAGASAGQGIRNGSLANWIPSSRLPAAASNSAGAGGTTGNGLKRTLSRTLSKSGSMQLQTHLSFRRESMYTRGKRWDRTAFAASGRRLDAEKTRKKRKRSKGDEESDAFDEDEDNDPFGLEPPTVDMNAPYEPQKHRYSEVTIHDYLYPTNHPKREYQYEIIRACFTDNCLVALPTGLGKTFVAGVVMLNFYRWFPSGKIVFLAPTKPLVLQQIEACQLTCGIPSGDAAVMTGNSVPAKDRERLWAERRVFYCTPQTLDNDLKRGALDPRDIVLAVFDEAHKASGSYAYTTILAYITARQPYFRVLALTATPGGDVPKVQAVVDALHISRIEIREAEAPEIRKYMNEKKTEKHVVRMGCIIEELRDRWATLMKPFIQKLVERNILVERDLDAKRLRTFRLTAKRMEILRDRNSRVKWAACPLAQLEKMARAMGNLLEFSLGMFHTNLLEIAGHTTREGKKGNSRAGTNALRSNLEFQRILGDVEGEINDIRNMRHGRTAADRHPKMHKTLELLLAHFAQAEEDEQVHGIKNDTRAMVFCSFRDCVLDIVDMLNDHPALLRATKFVGQSQGKQERDKGFNQKEQKRTIQEFKDGKFNVLVSTSIGEEGLDIGEVDFVVIYDMPKQSIKLLQRIGRTGRKRDGHVHVLMSEDREDSNWDAAQRTHRDIQEEILHSRNLELFEDVERLLPAGPLPACLEQEMDIDPWDPAEAKHKLLPAASQMAATKGAKGKSKGAGTVPAKRMRGQHIPEGGFSGFKSVAELLREAGERKRPRKSRSGDPLDLDLDEDLDLDADLGLPSLARGEDNVLSEDEAASDSGDDEAFDAQEHALLYGPVPSARTRPALTAKGKRRTPAKPGANTTPGSGQRALRATAAGAGARADSGKPAASSTSASAPRSTPRSSLTDEQRAEAERLSREAIAFFAQVTPQRGFARARSPSPSRSASPTMSDSSVASLGLGAGRGRGTRAVAQQKAPAASRDAGAGRLSPRTASAAGFSQVYLFSSDDEAF